MNNMKGMARPFGVLFAIALIIAVIGRVGLGIMSASGALAYDYISASGVAMLDVVCSILTGSAFVAFLFAAFLGTLLGAASQVVCACIACARKSGKLGVRLVVATAVCGIIVMILTVGTFSALNRIVVDLGALGVWFVVDALVNIAIMAGAMRIGSFKKETCAKNTAA